ncbi:hypothetical protein M8818_003167 [Zalaria obscura]|uniref:Uncharacterized protein n=1 Tax=Zalaria obscura TaxID=2024903 RepID=A0ACC3SF97_9PEZI
MTFLPKASSNGSALLLYHRSLVSYGLGCPNISNELLDCAATACQRACAVVGSYTSRADLRELILPVPRTPETAEKVYLRSAGDLHQSTDNGQE